MISTIALAWYAASTAWSAYRDKRQYDLGNADRKMYSSDQHFYYITMLLMMGSMLFNLTNMQYMLYFFLLTSYLLMDYISKILISKQVLNCYSYFQVIISIMCSLRWYGK